METATCIAKSSRLVSRTQEIHQFKPVATRTETHNELNAFRRKNDCALVVQGETMETILKVRVWLQLYATFGREELICGNIVPQFV